MINKFFNHGTGGSSGVLNYLLGKDREREQAQVIRGDEEITSQLIDSSLFKRKYTSGCLSFEEKNIPDHQKQALMNEFESLILAGIDQQDVNFLWVEHKDKDRLELNFVIPNTHLSTGKSFTPYVHQIDLKRFDTWKNLQNIKYQFSDPNEPIKKQLLTTNSNQEPSRKKATSDINQAVLHGITNGLITNRADIVSLLETRGHNVSQRKNYLSIVMPGKQNLRLKGALYEQTFTTSGLDNAGIKKLQREYNESTKGNYAKQQQSYSELQQAASRRNQERYRPSKQGATGTYKESSKQNTQNYRVDNQFKNNGTTGDISSSRSIIHNARVVSSQQRNIQHHNARNAPIMRKLIELRQSHDRNRESTPKELRGASKRLSNSIQRVKQTNELTSRLNDLGKQQTRERQQRSLYSKRVARRTQQKTRDVRFMR